MRMRQAIEGLEHRALQGDVEAVRALAAFVLAIEFIVWTKLLRDKLGGMYRAP